LIEHLHRLLSLPLLMPMLLSTQRAVIEADLRRWTELLRVEGALAVLRLPAFRTLYLHRLGRGNRLAHLVGWLLTHVYRAEETLHLDTFEIGSGLFVEPGYGTILSARRIGANCTIGTDVTVGFKGGGGTVPVIEDGVVIEPGAKVLGDIVLGENCVVEANAVVLHDVPANHVASGAPARVAPRA